MNARVATTDTKTHKVTLIARDGIGPEVTQTVYSERKTLTRDVGGTTGATQFTDAVMAAIQ